MVENELLVRTLLDDEQVSLQRTVSGRLNAIAEADVTHFERDSRDQEIEELHDAVWAFNESIDRERRREYPDHELVVGDAAGQRRLPTVISFVEPKPLAVGQAQGRPEGLPAATSDGEKFVMEVFGGTDIKRALRIESGRGSAKANEQLLKNLIAVYDTEGGGADGLRRRVGAAMVHHTEVPDQFLSQWATIRGHFINSGHPDLQMSGDDPAVGKALLSLFQAQEFQPSRDIEAGLAS